MCVLTHACIRVNSKHLACALLRLGGGFLERVGGCLLGLQGLLAGQRCSPWNWIQVPQVCCQGERGRLRGTGWNNWGLLGEGEQEGKAHTQSQEQTAGELWLPASSRPPFHLALDRIPGLHSAPAFPAAWTNLELQLRFDYVAWVSCPA